MLREHHLDHLINFFEKEQAKDDHAQDVLPVCQRNATITRDAIERGYLEEGNFCMVIVHVILVEAQNGLQYKEHMRNKGLNIHNNLFVFVFW